MKSIFNGVVLFFVSVIVNASKKLNYDVKPVRCITQVQSRVDRMTCNAHELKPEEYLRACDEGSKLINRVKYIPRKDVEYNDTFIEYVLEIGPNRWSVSFRIVTAFKCPTIPTLYVHFHHYDVTSENAHLWIIFKIEDTAVVPEYIKGYQITFFENVTEAFSDEINPTNTETEIMLENSLLDSDELSEEERFKFCIRALSHITSEVLITLLDDDKCTSSNRYYVVQRSDAQGDTSSDPKLLNMQNIARGIVQAFECPTEPRVYIHVNFQEYAGLTTWIIMQQSKEQSDIAFVGYQFKAFLHIIRVSVEAIRKINPNKSERSAIDFDEITDGERYQMCSKAVQLFFGDYFTVSFENIEIKRSKFYALYETEDTGIDDCDLVQALRCPTQPTVYIHVSERSRDGHVLWVLARKVDFTQKDLFSLKIS